jgi:GNAT superfamily N-acetyltransferase
MVTIRPAGADDRADLFRLASAFPTPTAPSAEQFATAFDAMRADTSACVLVAERDGELAGYLSGCMHRTFYAGGATAWVDEVFVVELARGEGTGRLLMETFESWAMRNNCVLVSLATRGAAQFYEHLGYETKAAYYKKYLKA